MGEGSREDIAAILRENYFCICIDESTDIGKDKSLAIIVRYINPDDGYVLCKTWDMARLFKKGEKAKATAQRIFDCIENSFAKYSIPITNIYACCFDGCNTMIGERSDLKAILNETICNIICVQCPAHMTHLCAQHAIEELPDEVMKLFTHISSMLRSAHRLHDYAELQRDMEIDEHKILNMSMTRWLSLESSVIRILEQYDCLLQFSEKLATDKDPIGVKVYLCMSKPETRAYLCVLRKTLRELNILNKFFQKKGVIIHQVGKEIEKRYRNIVSCFLTRQYVISTPVAQIEILDERNYLRYVDFELGDEIRDFLIYKDNDTEIFCKNTFNYLIALAFEMKTRFNDFSNPAYEFAVCLDPQNATSEAFRKENPNILINLLQTYRKVIDDNHNLFLEIKVGWENVLNIPIPKNLITFEARVEDFWIYVKNFQNIDGTLPCASIGDFALLVLATPHANADPERCFSTQNNIKTKNKNKMLVETVDGTLRTKETVSSTKEHFEPTEKMISIALPWRYYKNKYAKGRVV